MRPVVPSRRPAPPRTAVAVAGVAVLVATAAHSPADRDVRGSSGVPSGRTSVGAGTGPGADVAAARAGWARPDASTRTAPTTLTAAAADSRPTRVVAVHNVAGRPRFSVAVAGGRTAATAAVAAAQRSPDLVSVGIDTRVRKQEATPGRLPSDRRVAAAAADPYRSLQWGLQRLHADQAWAAEGGSTGAGVTVAVVDSGVDADHPDLAANVLTGGAEFSDGSGANLGDGTEDADGHGTHVAGIVAAVANNGVGGAGLAPGASILPVRVLDEEGSGWSSDVARGVVYAADHGAEVVNMSLGGSQSSALADAVAYAQSKGVVVVAAAGNSRQDGNPTTYPANYPGVLGVAATDEDDAVATFSNHGSYVDLAAPGVGITSTVPGTGYGAMSGTSMATPFVAAAAALVFAANPAASATQVAATLQATADDLGTAGRDDDSGHGLVDPVAALGGDPVAVAAPTTTSISARSARIRYGTAVAGTARVRRSADGLPVPAAPVRICTRTAPATTYTCRSATAGSTGAVAYRLTPKATTRIYVAHPGTATTAASTSPVVTYTVVPRVTLGVGTRALGVTVAPALRQRISLDRWTGSAWVGQTSAVLSTRGTVTFSRLTSGRTYRVRAAATTRATSATSGGVRVR